MLYSPEVADPVLLLQFKCGGTAIIANPEEIADWLAVNETRPRGFAMSWQGLEVTGYKMANEIEWRKA